MGVLATRLRYGSLAVLLIVGVFWLDQGPLPFLTAGLTLSLFALAAQYEFYGMLRSYRPENEAPMVVLGLLAGGLYLLSRIMPAILDQFGDGGLVLDLPWYDAGSCLAVVVVLLLVVGVLGRRPLGAPVRIGGTLVGVLTIPFLLGYAIELRYMADGWAWLVFLVAGAKAGDSMAFFVGRYLGHRKLIPEVSPNKTWEGAIASIFGTVLATWLVVETAFVSPPSLGMWLGAAVVVNIGAQFGDLSESLLKRGCEVKDSSTLIPVMGGAFDLVDSFICAAPMLRLYLALSQGV